MEGCVFLHAEQVTAAEFILEALYGLHCVLIGGMEAFGSCCVGYLEALIVVSIQSVKGVCIVSDYIKEVCYLVGRKQQFFVENILQQTHCPLQVLILLLGNDVAVDYITMPHVLFNYGRRPLPKRGCSYGINAVAN